MNSKQSSLVSHCKYLFALPLIFTLLLLVNQLSDGFAKEVGLETKTNSSDRLIQSKRDTLNIFELYQNVPNPVRTKTFIGFNLPKAAFASITVCNVEGGVVKKWNDDFEKGYHEIELLISDLELDTKYTGVLYYQLDCEDFTKTRKIILLEEE
jgi:hypothetical protein